MADERRQIKRITRELGDFSGRAIGQLMGNVLDELVAATPRDTGYAAASWRPSVEQPDFREGRRGAPGVPAAQRAQDAGRARVERLDIRRDERAYITGTAGYLTTLNEDPIKGRFVQRAIRKGVAKPVRARGNRVR